MIETAENDPYEIRNVKFIDFGIAQPLTHVNGGWKFVHFVIQFTYATALCFNEYGETGN